MKPLISVAITTHNRLEDLENTLDQLGRYEGQYEELLVCADGCSDGTQEYVRKEYPAIRLMENYPGEGSIPSRNNMIRTSKSPYVLLLDDDSYPIESHFFKQVQDLMEKYPEIGVLTFPQRSEEFPESLTMENFGPNKRVGTFTSSGAVIRKSLFEELGGFPDYFFHAYEEPDYSIRVHAKGLFVVQWCELTVRHHFTQAMRDEGRTHRRHARNEMWSTIMRAPFPLILILIPYRLFSHARYALGRGVLWLLKEPKWWFAALQKCLTAWRLRSPVSSALYRSWLRLMRDPELWDK